MFQSFLIGVALAALPGTIFIEVVRRTVLYGLWSGIGVALGEFVGHVTSFVAIFVAVREVTSIHGLATVFYPVGAVLLGVLAVSALRVTPAHVHATNTVRPGQSFVVGYVVSISDPFVIGLWASLSASYLPSNAASAFLHILDISAGCAAFFVAVASVLNSIHLTLSPTYLVRVSKLSGLVLLYFALELAHQALNAFGIR